MTTPAEDLEFELLEEETKATESARVASEATQSAENARVASLQNVDLGGPRAARWQATANLFEEEIKKRTEVGEFYAEARTYFDLETPLAATLASLTPQQRLTFGQAAVEKAITQKALADAKHTQALNAAQALEEEAAQAEAKAAVEEEEEEVQPVVIRLPPPVVSTVRPDPFPDFIAMSTNIQLAMQRAGMSAATFCTLVLNGNAQEPVFRPGRKVKLALREDSTGPRIIALSGIPKFADVIYNNTSALGQPPVLEQAGVIQNVKFYPEANIYEIKVENPSATFRQWRDIDKKDWDVELRDFEIWQAPMCRGNVQNNDVVATFLSQAGAVAKYNGWVTGAGADPVEAISQKFVDLMSKKQPKCPAGGTLVDGICREQLSQAMISIGEVKEYKKFAEDTVKFQQNFAVLANGGIEEPWVLALTAQFLPDQTSFDSYRKLEFAHIAQLKNNKDKCTATYLLRMIESARFVYLLELDRLWQIPMIADAQKAAVMWLLYFTQLPVIRYALFLLFAPVYEAMSRKTLAQVLFGKFVNQFQPMLASKITHFLQRDESNPHQAELVDNIIAFLERVRISTQKAFADELSTKAPECLFE